MRKVAIVDLGTARAKLTIGKPTVGAGIQTHQHKWDVNLGAGDADAPARLRAALHEILAAAEVEGARIEKVLATEAFRANAALRELLPVVEKLLGRVEILTPPTEALLFWQSVGHEALRGSRGVATDVGGGSVQVVWGGQADDSISIPAGTFSLEKRFQREPFSMAPNEIDAARRYIRALLDPIRQRVPNHVPLVVGSSIMGDFFSSAVAWCARSAGVSPHGLKISDPQQVSGVPIELLRVITTKVVGVPYAEVYEIFPENPKFMHGADKALIVVGELADVCKSSIIIPTNESISTALVRRLARE